ncbi:MULTISPECIES: hypothetical protein [unclassified Haematospirillum]|uniref:hypothetical protein n=1 Tax=unclassified Haematospirillum TaxID=2622088 RepID=UPI00143B8349|nr:MULTISPECIES: hypothetical protein [unclassified Haematospirillum]NKD55137.1 hypothetical protein [Haematospirillum sp. H4890]NKD75390.1 hypothetical protein [Haematospirillum sp. H4485]NKD87664.1 hypothetical protein [Haematospirillum sp. 15-248]
MTTQTNAAATISTLITEAGNDLRGGIMDTTDLLAWMGRALTAGLSFMSPEDQQAFASLLEGGEVPSFA